MGVTHFANRFDVQHASMRSLDVFDAEANS